MDDDYEDSGVEENLTMLTWQFKKILKANKKRLKCEWSNFPRGEVLHHNQAESFKSTNRLDDRIQFHNCEGCGHIVAECANNWENLEEDEEDPWNSSEKQMISFAASSD